MTAVHHPVVRQRTIALERPQLTPAGPFTTVWAVDVDLFVGGRGGRGMGRAFSQEQADGIETATRALADDPRVRGALAGSATGDTRLDAWAEVWDALAKEATAGPMMTALAAVDDAVWDLALGELGPPRAGHPTASARVYWSGLWLHSTLDELVAETAWALAQGHDAVKLRVDGTSVDDSLARARAVSRACPPARSLALEFAGSGTPDTVAAIVAGLAPGQILWVEDPLPSTAEAQLAELIPRLGVPVATGEDCWGVAAVQERVARTGTTVPVVDLGLVGGPTALFRFLADGSCGCDQVGVHIDALPAAAVVARAPGTQTVWLEVFDWWGAVPVDAVRHRAAHSPWAR